MSDTPFFSVVIPVYNKEPHIARAINSVLNQTFQDFELIIVCDPSTDNSNAEVAKFTDPRIRVFYRNVPGPGGYAARNLAVEKARSKWICFLDADDQWTLEHLSLKNKYIQKKPDIKIFSGSWEVVNHEDKTLDSFSNSIKKDCVIDFYSYVKNENENKRAIFTSVLTVERELISKNGFPSGKINMGGDVDTWLRCVYEARKIVFIRKKLALYHIDSVSMVTKSSCVDPMLHCKTTEYIIKRNCRDIVKKVLLQRKNGLVFYAWKNNIKYCQNENFLLFKYISLSGLKLRWSLYLILALFPKKVLKVFWR